MDGAQRDLRDDARVQPFALSDRPCSRDDLVLGLDVAVLDGVGGDLERREVQLDDELARLGHVGDTMLLREAVRIATRRQHHRAVADDALNVAALVAGAKRVDFRVLGVDPRALGADLLVVLGPGTRQCGLSVALGLVVLRDRLGVTLLGRLHGLRMLRLRARHELLQRAQRRRRLVDRSVQRLRKLPRLERDPSRRLLQQLEVERVIDTEGRGQQPLERLDAGSEIPVGLFCLGETTFEVEPFALSLLVGTLALRLALTPQTLTLERTRDALRLAALSLRFPLCLDPVAARHALLREATLPFHHDPVPQCKSRVGRGRRYIRQRRSPASHAPAARPPSTGSSSAAASA